MSANPLPVVDQNTAGLKQVEPNVFELDAVSIGIAPKQKLPLVIETTLGDGQPFKRCAGTKSGDVASYVQKTSGLRITVFND